MYKDVGQWKFMSDYTKRSDKVSVHIKYVMKPRQLNISPLITKHEGYTGDINFAQHRGSTDEGQRGLF